MRGGSRCPGERLHNPDLKKVRCTVCGRPEESGENEGDHQLRPDPVGGSAALREARSRHDSNWVKGAAGEYLMDRSLHRRLTADAIILTDRRVPGVKSNIDHLVVASSGAWIIDTKNWKGRIEYKASSMTGTDFRLLVGDEDRTVSVEKIYSQVIPVAQSIDDRSVPIHPALVFIEGDWSTVAAARLLVNRPYQHLGVWITTPKNVAKMINDPGPLDAAAVQNLGRTLDRLFVPA